jgi:hypothetical protein
MLCKKGFSGCSIKKSWNKHKVFQQSNTDKHRQKNKYPTVKVRDNPCKSVAKKNKMRIARVDPYPLTF